MGKGTAKERTMISIITSTYNRADRLKRAIKSVLKQTYPDWEMIIVDDNSKDHTKEIAERFVELDSRIVYIRRTKNFGNDTKPKNAGIMASKGEYICFLDDDNEFRPEHLAILLREIEKDPPVDVVYGDRWLVCDPGTPHPIKPQLGFTHEFDPAFLMQRNFIDSSDILVKRKALFDVGGFDEGPDNNKYIDWNLYVRMTKAGMKFRKAHAVITNYHLHKGMKSLRVKTKGDTETTFVPNWDPYDVEVEMPYLGNEVRVPRVAVYTLTYDRLKYTKQSFASLKKTAGYLYDHYVVDNGSKDGTQEWLKENIDEDKLILNEKNVGISKASNQAVDLIKQHGGYDIIVKWDNDCIGLTKNWLTKMIEIWKSNHMFALSCYVQGLADHPGGASRLGFGLVKGELVGVTKHLGGICHFVDARAYDVFRWDENSFLHGVQDLEFSQWLQFHQYSMGYLENYFVSHGPMGTELQKKDYPDYFERRIKERQTRYEAT